VKVVLIPAAEVFEGLPKEAGKQGNDLIWAKITSINTGKQIT